MERDQVTVAEAAKRLGISESAVRKRVARDQVEYDRDDDGRLYVYLTPTDRVVDNVRDELVNELRDRVDSLERSSGEEREARRRADTIIAQLTSRIPELLAATVPPTSSATPTDQSSTGDVRTEQEKPTVPPCTNSAQAAASFLPAPTDKLPAWQYVLGIAVSAGAQLLAVSLTAGAQLLGLSLVLAFYIQSLLNVLPLATLVPLGFGLWVGIKRRRQQGWGLQTIGIGLTISILSSLGHVIGLRAATSGPAFEHLLWEQTLRFITVLGSAYVLAPMTMYVSGALLGNALQRRAARMAGGARPGPRIAGKERPLRQQVILAVVTAALPALLSGMATIIVAVMNNGGQ